MSVIVNTGEIEGPERTFFWSIPNYFSLPQKADSCVESPIFRLGGSAWCLIIYPNGRREERSVGHIGLYIRRIDPGKDIKMTFGLKIIDDEGEEFGGHFWKKGYNFDRSITGNTGWPFCFERQQLLKYQEQFVPDGTLTVKFFVGRLKTLPDTEFSDGVSSLVRDFQSLLTSEQKSDVSIILEDKIFRVHKLILGARSSVFAAMFKHDMKEKRNNVVNIADCDASSFQDFLSFIYTGKIKNLSSDEAINLHYLAEKYDICDLKQICLDFMGKNLSLDNVCDILAIAHNFDASKLKKSAKELLGNNLDYIMKTKHWINFIQRNPELATEILRKYTVVV